MSIRAARANIAATLWASGVWANTNNTFGLGTIISSTHVAGDPAFVNPAAWDYHIGVWSAARDAGGGSRRDH